MRFYCDTILETSIITGEEAFHCIKVLRCKVNDTIELMNGMGDLFNAQIIEIKKSEVVVKIDKEIKHLDENPNKLSVAICLTKLPSRLEWFVEKATEIGIAAIYPILTDRTEKKNLKDERLKQIIISAGKQSGQLFFPALHPLQTFKQFITSPIHQFSNHFIAHCEDEKQHLKNVYPKHSSSILLIGPEGDFTKDEVRMAVNNNYIPVSLGNSILRVETAGVVACSIVNSINFEG